MATPIPNAKIQLFDASGNPLSGGKLYTYQAGTTTPLASYTDATEGVSNANPVILDSAGMANVWLGQSAYKLQLQNSAGSTLWTVDNVYGGSLLSGYLTAIERAAPSGVAGSDILYADSTAHRLKMINNNGAADSVVGAATTDTLTNKTLTTPTITSPVINGTPSGTGIPTVTVKKGSGAGTYTHGGDTNFVDADAVNLAYTVTIPTGWKLTVSARGAMGVQTALVEVDLRLVDNGAEIAISRILPAAINNFPAGDSSLLAVINGDGASHTVKLQFKTTNGADTANLSNSSATDTPVMMFLLTPSN
jgi:hypothetical protein